MDTLKRAESVILSYHLNPTEEQMQACLETLKGIFESPDTQTLEQRKQAFIEDVRPFVEEMGKEEANRFVKYWLEISPKGRKFRFEKEKSFNVKLRISTWMRNKSKWSIINSLKR